MEEKDMPKIEQKEEKPVEDTSIKKNEIHEKEIQNQNKNQNIYAQYQIENTQPQQELRSPEKKTMKIYKMTLILRRRIPPWRIKIKII